MRPVLTTHSRAWSRCPGIVRAVESYREDGKVKQRVVADSGRKDLLIQIFPKLRRLFGGDSDNQDSHSSDPKILDVATWGPVLAVRALFTQLGLWSILETHLGKAKGVPFVDRAFVLVGNRLIRPTSEHGLAGWLETDFVCDRQGRRFLPNWHQHNRVRVHFSQLEAWCRTLDQLLVAKDMELNDVEQGFRQLKDVSAMRPIYHRVEHRVKAHIFVAALALLIHLIQCRQGLTSELRLGKVVILLRSAPQPVVDDSVCIRAGLDSDWLGSSCHCLCAACRCGFAENKLELTCGDHDCNRVLLDLSFCAAPSRGRSASITREIRRNPILHRRTTQARVGPEPRGLSAEFAAMRSVFGAVRNGTPMAIADGIAFFLNQNALVAIWFRTKMCPRRSGQTA